MSVWPFKSRGARVGTVAPKPELPPFEEFEHNNATIHVHLPASLAERIAWISKSEDASGRDVVRALLFQYLYGQLAYTELIRSSTRRRADEVVASALSGKQANWVFGPTDTTPGVAESDEIKRSTSRNNSVTVERFGAADDNWRLELPLRMKEDLKKVAKHDRLKLSQTVRRILVLQLFGGVVHADWQATVGATPHDQLRLEEEANRD